MEKRKMKLTQHKILTHEQKISFCEDYLEANGYTEISKNTERDKYPIPDLIAKKKGLSYAIECGSLSSTEKIQDLLKIYHVVIHFYEYKGELVYLFFKRGNYELTDMEESIISKEELINKLNKDLEQLKEECTNLKIEKNKISIEQIIVELVRILSNRNYYGWQEENKRWIAELIILKYMEIRDITLNQQQIEELNKQYNSLNLRFR